MAASEAEIYALETKIRNRLFNKALSIAVSKCVRSDPRFRSGVGYFEEELLELNPLVIGSIMEKTDQLLKDTNTEVLESKKILQDLANEIRALSDVVNPSLMEQIKNIRQARMTVVSEIRESLSALREIRAFFLESNYETEMQRLERFVRLCREIQALKSEGVFDAVCDTAIRMALKEESL